MAQRWMRGPAVELLLQQSGARENAGLFYGYPKTDSIFKVGDEVLLDSKKMKRHATHRLHAAKADLVGVVEKHKVLSLDGLAIRLKHKTAVVRFGFWRYVIGWRRPVERRER